MSQRDGLGKNVFTLFVGHAAFSDDMNRRTQQRFQFEVQIGTLSPHDAILQSVQSHAGVPLA